jgi:hypothetical protein
VGWFKTGKQAKEFAEAQTQGQYYVVKRKRTKVDILRRAGVRKRGYIKFIDRCDSKNR